MLATSGLHMPNTFAAGGLLQAPDAACWLVTVRLIRFLDSLNVRLLLLLLLILLLVESVGIIC